MAESGKKTVSDDRKREEGMGRTTRRSVAASCVLYNRTEHTQCFPMWLIEHAIDTVLLFGNKVFLKIKKNVWGI